MADIKRPAQEARLFGRRKRNAVVQKGGHHIAELTKGCARITDQSGLCLPARSPPLSRSAVDDGTPSRPNSPIRLRSTPHPRDDEPRDHPSLVADARGR